MKIRDWEWRENTIYCAWAVGDRGKPLTPAAVMASHERTGVNGGVWRFKRVALHGVAVEYNDHETRSFNTLETRRFEVYATPAEAWASWRDAFAAWVAAERARLEAEIEKVRQFLPEVGAGPAHPQLSTPAQAALSAPASLPAQPQDRALPWFP